jgi:glycerophosphoryl diester phosphodiesterase
MLLAIAAVVVLVGAVAAVAVIVFGGSSKKPNAAAGHTGSGAQVSATPPSTHVSNSSSAARSTAATTTGFVAIPPVLAHRGDHEGYPQETIPSFLQAAQRGFTIETDIRWSGDDVAIVNHDQTTGLGMICSGGPYRVAQTKLSVLESRCRTTPSESKDGKAYGIPTFDSAVHQIADQPGATLFAEIKTDQTTEQNQKFLATLQKYDMVDRTVITSFFSSYLDNFYQVAHRAGVAVRTLRFASAEQPTSLSELRQIHAWGVVFLMESGKALPSYVTSVRHAGFHMGIATTSPPGPGDTAVQWQQAKNLGAEFLLTDHPSLYNTWRMSH